VEKKEIKRTPAQDAAVNARGRSLMISAAAGSGKTATLTQRIVSLITDRDSPADIGNMLVVTFTRKAAGELRQRITDAINSALIDDPQNRHLQKQLTSVGAADICTIDSYYLGICKENFQKLGLPASFSMADPAETEILAREIADKVIERMYDSEPGFAHLADTLTSAKGEGALANIIIDLANDTASLENGEDSLLESANVSEEEANCDFFESRTGKILKSDLIISLKQAEEDLVFCMDLAGADDNFESYLATLSADLGTVRSILSALEHGLCYEKTREAVMNYAPQSIGRAKKGSDEETKGQIQDARGAVKKLLEGFKTNEFALTAEEIGSALRETAALVRTLAKVISAYGEAFREAKNTRMIADFSDLARYASALLDNGDGTPSAIAMSEKAKYSHIFVDEYQDTDARQDKIFNLISRGDNLFIVGDIKQSIYSFRGARPNVFAGYRDRWAQVGQAKPDAPAAIYMSENFRCAKKIIEFTNEVCRRLFSEGEETKRAGCGIGYRTEDDLIFRCNTTADHPVEVIACEGVVPSGDKEQDEKLTAAEKNGKDNELRVIVEKIREIAARRGNPEAGIYAYSDIAVLARNKKALAAVAEALTAEGIPFSNNDGQDLFANPEVILFNSLLSSIDNPMRDTSLAGALRSPIFGFTLSDLTNIKLGRRSYTLWDAINEYSGEDDSEPELAQKCRYAIEKLRFWRAQSEEIPVDRFIRFLWKETGAAGYSGSDPASAKQKPAERQSNLRALYEYARSFQSSGFRTLHDFVTFVAGILGDGSSIAIPPSPATGAVSLMTVHKSKGLEFPCVILCSTSTQFNGMDAKSGCVFTDYEGIGPVGKLTDDTGMCVEDTPMRRAVAGLMSNFSDEEEIRILYVALTRAKEELYVTAHGKCDFMSALESKAAQSRKRGLHRIVCTGKSWFEWIVYALSGLDAERADGFFRLKTVPSPAQTTAEAEPETEAETTEKVPAACPASDISEEESVRRADCAYAKMKAAIDASYAFDTEAAIPAKLSVSALYPDLITDAEKDDTAVLIDKGKDKTPRFMGGEEAGAADKGTATHLFLQFCDFTNLDGTMTATENEIERLVSLSFIPPKTAAIIRKDEINGFASSPFFAELKKARRTERERRFNILLPAADFTTDEALRERLKNEKVLVQGVIDVFFESENGELVLCDYKTDRIPKKYAADKETVTELMTERHGEQLSYYASAIKAMFGKAPDRICVFPLAFGDVVEIAINK